MNKQKGFTLIELLVVIAIIGLLSTLAVVSLNSARSKARDARRTSDIRQIQTALDMYYNDAGEYPQTANGDTITLGSATDNGSVLCYEAADTTPQEGFYAATTNCDTTIMSQVPEDPQSAQSYTYGDNFADASTYSITFTLENDNATWGGNSCTASPGQITCN